MPIELGAVHARESLARAGDPGRKSQAGLPAETADVIDANRRLRALNLAASPDSIVTAESTRGRLAHAALLGRSVQTAGFDSLPTEIRDPIEQDAIESYFKELTPSNQVIEARRISAEPDISPMLRGYIAEHFINGESANELQVFKNLARATAKQEDPAVREKLEQAYEHQRHAIQTVTLSSLNRAEPVGEAGFKRMTANNEKLHALLETAGSGGGWSDALKKFRDRPRMSILDIPDTNRRGDISNVAGHLNTRPLRSFVSTLPATQKFNNLRLLINWLKREDLANASAWDRSALKSAITEKIGEIASPSKRVSLQAQLDTQLP